MADETNSTTPPAGTDFEPAGTLEQTGATFESDSGKSDTGAGTEQSHEEHKAAGTAGAFFEQAQKFYGQAGEKAKAYAADSKERAGAALDQFTQMLSDAASQVEERLGADYGKYARSAADAVGGFSEQIKAKDIDELVNEARSLVAKSPAIAIGTAAAIGFVVARLAKAGVDAASEAAEPKTGA
jgi:ElaB/YqjD/DUF883 family membrane-anchored ribosome-binding protein